jgi:hypothetical protein
MNGQRAKPDDKPPNETIANYVGRLIADGFAGAREFSFRQKN